MLEMLKKYLAERSLAIYAGAFLALALLIFYEATRPKPLPTTPIEVIQREAEAKAEAKYAKQHETEVTKHEAEAKTHEDRESQLSGNIQTLKRELESLRKGTGHVGGGEPSDAGSSGDAPMDDPVVAKLNEIVEEQGSLIVELKKDKEELKLALVDSKLATASYKVMADKRLQDVEILNATVNNATAQAKSEIAKAEWRGGFKGFAAGFAASFLRK